MSDGPIPVRVANTQGEAPTTALYALAATTLILAAGVWALVYAAYDLTPELLEAIAALEQALQEVEL